MSHIVLKYFKLPPPPWHNGWPMHSIQHINKHSKYKKCITKAYNWQSYIQLTWSWNTCTLDQNEIPKKSSHASETREASPKRSGRIEFDWLCVNCNTNNIFLIISKWLGGLVQARNLGDLVMNPWVSVRIPTMEI